MTLLRTALIWDINLTYQARVPKSGRPTTRCLTGRACTRAASFKRLLDRCPYRGGDAADDPEVVKSMTLRQRPSAPLRHTVRYRPFSVASLPLASGAVTSFVPNV